MIILVGLRHDPIIKYLHKELAKTSLIYAFIDQQCIGGHINIDHLGFSSKMESWCIQHSQIQAVINRLVGSPSTYCQKHNSQLELLIHYLDNVYPVVLNRPSKGLSNNSKPLQLSILDLVECEIPRSFICAGMLAPETRNLIFKSISSVRSIVNEVTDPLRPVLEPVLFQEKCCGKNIRVHCLDTHSVATEITASEIDYRYAKHQSIREFSLPSKMQQECISLNRQLGLIFSGIDFILIDDKWVLLEINPAPGFAYYEHSIAHKPISNMVINYLQSLT